MEKTRKVLRLDTEKNFVIEEETFKVSSDKKSLNRSLSLFSLALDLGFSISIPILGGIIAGKWLDDRFGTMPTMTLSFLFFGIIIGSISIWRLIKMSKK